MIYLIVVVALVVMIMGYFRQAMFGRAPSGERLAKIKKSTHYRNNEFQNVSPTPQLTEGHSIVGVMYQYFFQQSKRRVPSSNIPAIKTNLFQLPADDLLVWFGHSSYWLQLAGKKFLVDPVLSDNASPLPGTNKAFPGTNLYSPGDIPPFDYLVITHDHYDHLDYRTVTQLRNKVRKVICGLGVGEHLERWGYDGDTIIELDWHDELQLDHNVRIMAAPARHFSGRGLKRNNTLWLSILLITAERKIYIGGDSGYDQHFKKIGTQYGPVDLAILDNGQYDVAWQLIHMLPEEVLQAAQDLQAKHLLPVHSGKFAMANHDWDEPLKKLTISNTDPALSIITPKIGEVVALAAPDAHTSRWWDSIS